MARFLLIYTGMNETTNKETAMKTSKRAYDGMAQVEDVNGIRYIHSYKVEDTDAEILAAAERFYEVKMAKVISRGKVI